MRPKTTRSAASQARYRRPRSLVASFADDGSFVVTNYLKDVKLEIDAAAFDLLGRFPDWKSVAEVARELRGWSRQEVLASVQALRSHELLVAEGDEYDLGLAAWKDWEDEARLLHFWSRDAFAKGSADDLRKDATGRWVQTPTATAWASEIRQEAAPPAFKRYPAAPRTLLPRAFVPLRASFEETLVERRTARNFSRAKITLRELSTLLHLTFAPMHMKDDREFGILQVRTSASGGSRHEAECYVGALEVEGLPRGLYHYCALEHSLELLRDDLTPSMVATFAAGQPWVRDASCVFFVTAVFERMRWKYRSSVAYRVVLLDVGFLGQTFALTSTALGLDPFQTAAIDCAGIERYLGLDPFEEGALLMTACGRVAPEDRHLTAPVPAPPTSIPLVRDHAVPRASRRGAR